MEGHAHMPTLNLQDIRDAADAKYGPVVIEGVPGGDVALVHPLRLSGEKFKALQEIFKREAPLGDDLGLVKSQAIDLIELVAPKKADAKRLLDAVGNDLGTLTELFKQYSGAMQVGEASPSAT